MVMAVQRCDWASGQCRYEDALALSDECSGSAPFDSDTHTEGLQKIRVTFMNLFLSTNKQPLKCGQIWLLLLLLTANVLLFVHLWHPSP